MSENKLDIDGNVGPVTWDGEPLYSPETVAEGLFDPEAFEQMPGQLAFDDRSDVRKAADRHFRSQGRDWGQPR